MLLPPSSVAGIAGSDEKDIVDAEAAVVAGAEVDTSPYTWALGLDLWGHPEASALPWRPSRSNLLASNPHQITCIFVWWADGYQGCCLSVFA